ncbi:hypothetical protein LPB137_11890 [Poseidonibacter parvus]|uniref:Glycosyltransferase 2-like domain-containing protein n=1 Tax=Poseidonibacter parvus TaxID=1850254 RepID=A0A1P8KPM2_9BACT|nr:glycosyltransferase family 2 protein [Poseidonibacter parvus]APW66497.1 hypothetical protein LPB137_11890 [Poseidonibacter parvus]
MIKKISKSILKFSYIVYKDTLRGDPFCIHKKAYRKYRQDGFKSMISRLDDEYKKTNNTNSKYLDQKKAYQNWIEENEEDIHLIEDLDYTPLISIITPTYNTEIKYLKEMIESVISQTYTNWELCIADDASTSSDTIDMLKDYETKYENIKVICRKENGHISEASNSALNLAWGEYLVLLDHDDTLSINALYEMTKKLNENKNLKLIYSDEDKIDEKGNRFDPHFKSGWNPDMFYSQNYLCHLVLLKKSIVDKIGGFRKGYEGSQDYDLLLRYLNEINYNEINRIEKILYHWRAIKGSTALNSKEKNYAHIAGLKVLKDYFSKKNENITVEGGLLANTYKVIYPIPEDQPKVTIIIPTRNKYTLLSKCINSIFEKTTYKNYEILVVNNGSNGPRILKYFEKIKNHDKIEILDYDKPFNYSAINNYAVKHASGEIITLLNNDVEVISKNWLTEMVSHAIREEIGAVGAMLYYDDDSIQHAGVILGIGGVAAHSHKYFKRNENGYFSRLKIIQNFSAVTGACIVVRKKLYEEVKGLNEENLKVAFNDIDFCLKLLKLGYKNLWTPYVELYHHESISRGKEDNPKKIKRFNTEVEYMKNMWGDYLIKDYYYNNNLCLIHENFGIKDR